ncbi:PLDc N-terminal domain-containing protein [Desulfosarcina sp. OttesenSCG-928-A07]|nr:PLDc N-terminal domain-containing protein [Desulfosarcina sp. OttesenSCG-928-G17]MDL2329333.1 PLDc N-terminal domain-containing protein [Desulfosarcina sp. OttesenSCG-928-A07]
MSVTQIILLTGLVFFLLTCIAIADIARKDFGSIQLKAVWGLLVAMVPFVGVLIYFLVGFRKGQKANAPMKTD